MISLIKRVAFTGSIYMVTMTQAYAAGQGADLPWEGPLNQLTESLSGPVLRSFLVISIVVAGLMMALTEVGAGAKRLLQAVFGLSVAVTAVSFFPDFFGFDAAATFR